MDMKTPGAFRNEGGIALITTLLVMALMSALMIGFTAAVTSDQKYRLIDRDRGRAFYGAHSGLEKLNAELATLFFQDLSPNDSDVNALAQNPPTIPDVTFLTSGSGAYGVRTVSAATSGNITTGPYQGLMALKKTYELVSSAKTAWGGEAHLRRRVETVAIPVFQFGMFSEVDLSFSAADNFDFGGRVHTNRNLFLAQGGGTSSTLTMRDRVTAVGEIVRKRLSNGESIAVSGSTRIVRVARAPNTFRNLLDTEGSVQDGPTSAANPAWTTLSLSSYNGYLRTGKTGARRLDLPVITTGGSNPDLVRRAAVNENLTNPTLLKERYFSKVSLRILLSDRINDILTLPTVTQTAPILLDGDWAAAAPNNGTVYGPVSALRPPVARAEGTQTMQVNGAVAGPNSNATINVDAPFNAHFAVPPMTLNIGAAVYTVNCTGKASATRFTTCTASPAPAGNVNITNGSSLTATIDSARVATTTQLSPGTQTITATTGAIGNLEVVNGLAFSRNTFWVQNTNQQVTCRGYAALQLTGCNVTATIADNAILTNNSLSQAGTGTLGGYIKIERQDPNGAWHDVTMEILNWGIAGPNLEGKPCGDPTPNAIVRLQRLRDNAERNENTTTWPGALCSYATGYRSSDYWPNTLFDTREAVYREENPGANNLRLGGVMHYVMLDVGNLSRWFAATGVYAGNSTGPNSMTDNGFSVYISDRRNNRNAASDETGEYGFEDFVNPASASGTPNASLDTGEDLNENSTLERYGQFPSFNGVYNSLPLTNVAPLVSGGASPVRPSTNVSAGIAKVNRAVFFRRAVKLTNAALGNIVAPGLTIAAENPVYVQGDWNANQAGFGEPNVATSIVADAITLLSNDWNDNNSFSSPYAVAGRPRGGHTWYRFATIAGKGRIFPRPANGEGATYGTDGGVHSFLRFLEGAGGADTIHYRGSMATFFFNRQAVSPFKCCAGIVYDVPVRDYQFDVDFLTPSLLPPLTPVFRDLNALGFIQETRAGH
jgi:Tfp pilus assembly protein PilX